MKQPNLKPANRDSRGLVTSHQSSPAPPWTDEMKQENLEKNDWIRSGSENVRVRPGEVYGYSRKRVIKQLVDVRRQLDAILRSLPDGVIVVDRSNYVVFVNDDAARLYGFGSAQELFKAQLEGGEVVGKFAFEITDEFGMKIDTNLLPLNRVFAGASEAQQIIRFSNIIDGQDFWKLVKAHPISDDWGEVQQVVVVMIDLTERMEEEKKKDEFISMASHELKTPLTTIKVFTEMLLRRATRADDTASGQLLSKMNRQVDRLSTLVRDLLDISRIQLGDLSLKIEFVNLNELIRKVLGELRRDYPDRLIVYDYDGENSVVQVDGKRIEQVLSNLVQNAIKYSQPKQQVLVQLRSSANGVEVLVVDKGKGISKRYQKKIFDKYYRIYHDEAFSYPGLGMGLYMVKQIIEAHNAELIVTSQPGKGSTFGFRISRPIVTEARNQLK